MVALASAVCLGSWAGLSLPWLAALWLPLCAAAGGFWLGAAAAERPSWRRGRAVCLLLALAALQALRAGAQDPIDPPGDWTPRPVEGRWQPLFESEDATHGRLTGSGRALPVFELPARVAAEGELLRLDPCAAPTRSARGPAPPHGALRVSVGVLPDEIVRLQPPRRGLLAEAARGAIGRARATLAARCEDFSDPWAAALAPALLLGERSRLAPAQADLFTRTGIRHLLAVSGQNVALFVTFLAAPLVVALVWGLARVFPRLAARRSELVRALLVLGVAVYSPLVGGEPPVRRAALAAGLGLLAPLLRAGATRAGGRASDALSLWSAALLLECLVEPAAVTSIGIQLSYCATLGLVLGVAPLERAMRRASWLAPLPSLSPGPMRRVADVLALRAARTLRLALAASAAATLATLPCTWIHFGEWSPIGLLVTPVALFLLALMLPIGCLALLAPGATLEPAFTALVQALVALARAADVLPGTPSPLLERPAWLILTSPALALAALAARERAPAAALRLGRIAAASGCLLLLPWTPAPHGLELVALDVGHGTAIAWRAPGAGCWVFDAGSRDRPRVAQSALGPLLCRWEVTQVSVILSHEDRDHQAGLSWLVERYPPSLWAGALPAPIAERLPHSTARVDTGRGALVLAPGGRCPGLELRLLRGSEAEGNEGSRSLWMAMGGAGVLLSGDAEAEGLAGLLEHWRPPEPVRMLLLPHHGSHTPWLGALLEATRPAEVWITCAGPPGLAGELGRRELSWRATSVDGPLSLRIPPAPLAGGDGTELAASKGLASRPAASRARD